MESGSDTLVKMLPSLTHTHTHIRSATVGNRHCSLVALFSVLGRTTLQLSRRCIPNKESCILGLLTTESAFTEN